MTWSGKAAWIQAHATQMAKEGKTRWKKKLGAVSIALLVPPKKEGRQTGLCNTFFHMISWRAQKNVCVVCYQVTSGLW